jgi:hypothetical protein
MAGDRCHRSWRLPHVNRTATCTGGRRQDPPLNQNGPSFLPFPFSLPSSSPRRCFAAPPPPHLPRRRAAINHRTVSARRGLATRADRHPPRRRPYRRPRHSRYNQNIVGDTALHNVTLQAPTLVCYMLLHVYMLD